MLVKIIFTQKKFWSKKFLVKRIFSQKDLGQKMFQSKKIGMVNPRGRIYDLPPSEYRRVQIVGLSLVFSDKVAYKFRINRTFISSRVPGGWLVVWMNSNNHVKPNPSLMLGQVELWMGWGFDNYLTLETTSHLILGSRLRVLQYIIGTDTKDIIFRKNL